MNVYLTFDVEVWCGGWDRLDERFPAAFERYVYGRSPAGDYALPKTLEIMHRHGLQGVFFVEPLFAARFGPRWLQDVVRLIRSAGQDVQLHLHPEWTDEIDPPLLDAPRVKRQHLTYYDLDEQTRLIAAGRALLEAAKGAPVTAFRAGSFAVNLDTYRALEANGILLDSSLNACYDLSAGTIAEMDSPLSRRALGRVDVYPVTVFRDGLGRPRPAQINGCSFGELRSALRAACTAGCEHFVIVSHNFEMLRPDSSAPDWTVVRRFESLCELLAGERGRMPVGPFRPGNDAPASRPTIRPRVPAWWTAQRLVEQALRRWP